MIAIIRRSIVARVLLIIFAALLLMGFTFQEVPDWKDFEAVVGWLAFGGGAPIVVAYALSLLIENWAGWHGLPKALRFLLPPFVSALLAIGANYLLEFPEVVAGVSPFWFIVISAFLAWLGTQFAYMKARAASYGAR